jgi:hypothetical protein
MPERWHTFSPDPPLDWQFVKFHAPMLHRIPQEPGVYAFIVQFQDHWGGTRPLPFHGYVMHACIAGFIGRTRTLRDRFGDYLREQKRGKRVSIWSMLNKWSSGPFFHYSIVPDLDRLAQIEIALNDAIIPPYVSNDFSAGVRALVRTLRAN